MRRIFADLTRVDLSHPCYLWSIPAQIGNLNSLGEFSPQPASLVNIFPGLKDFSRYAL